MSRRNKEVNNGTRRKKMKRLDRRSIPNKRKGIKQFTKILVEEYHFHNCGCMECRIWFETLYELSSKISNSLRLIVDENKIKEITKLNIALCLIDSSYLMNFIGHEDENGNRVFVINYPEGSFTDLLIKTIGNSYTSMTFFEKEYFGKDVLAIKDHFERKYFKKEAEKKEVQKEVELPS